VTANYSGDTNYSSASTSNAVTVSKATITLALVPGFTSLAANQSGVLTLNLSGGYGVPSGCSVTSANNFTPSNTITIAGCSSNSVTVDYAPASSSTSPVTISATYSDTNNTGATSYTFTPTTALGYSIAVGAITIGAPGQSATGTITLTPLGGFNPATVSFGSVTFAGSTPSGLSISQPGSFTQSGSNYIASFTVTSTAPTAHVSSVQALLWPIGVLFLFPVLALLRRHRAPILLLGLLIASFGAFTGCGGGGSSSGSTPSGGTPTGTYSLTATVTSSATSVSSGGYPALTATSPSFNLTVQ
jgi:hypothetical protein